jgi:hypothetical protein
MEIKKQYLKGKSRPSTPVCRRGLATGGAPVPIGEARHNISPRLFKQLVLELNVGVAAPYW